jgi:hypothetical protein
MTHPRRFRTQMSYHGKKHAEHMSVRGLHDIVYMSCHVVHPPPSPCPIPLAPPTTPSTVHPSWHTHQARTCSTRPTYPIAPPQPPSLTPPPTRLPSHLPRTQNPGPTAQDLETWAGLPEPRDLGPNGPSCGPSARLQRSRGPRPPCGQGNRSRAAHARGKRDGDRVTVPRSTYH